MAQASRPCKGCGATIYRTVPVAPIRHYCSPDCRPRCAVQGCDKPAHGKTYCSAHHTRWKRTGDPLTPKARGSNGLRKPRQKMIPRPCSVDGCEAPSRKRGWCEDHYGMWRRHGEIREFAYRWGDGGYVPTHAWLRRNLGRPETYSCVDCGRTAQEWSYNGGDPDEQVSDRGDKFTRNPDAYSPRCVRCHRHFDENPIAMRRIP